MLSIVAKWWVVPGNEDAAVAALAELAARVEAVEPFAGSRRTTATTTTGCTA